MAGLDTLKSGITNLLGETTELIQSNPIAAAGVAAGAAGVGGTVLGLALARKKSRKKSSKKKRKKHGRKKRRRAKGRKSRRGRRTPRTAGKGRDRSSKRIRYTKKGQPYVIMASGKARFIKKSGAKRSHKLKGGRY